MVCLASLSASSLWKSIPTDGRPCGPPGLESGDKGRASGLPGLARGVFSPGPRRAGGGGGGGGGTLAGSTEAPASYRDGKII